MPILVNLTIFTAKLFIILLFILLLCAGLLAIFSKGKEKMQGKLTIKSVNKKYQKIKMEFLNVILPKNKFKAFLKEQKQQAKEEIKHAKNIFVINFNGDIKASAVHSLREEVTAILNVATTNDEVVVKLESAGGMVNGYGLAAAQLQRLRQQHIPLTVCIDKIAASGGYLMACIANKILAAPFAIVGSIGVIVQLPNFNRVLKEKKIDFEQLTAGSFKRTLTMFGENTEEGRNKMQKEIEEIHVSFKNLIKDYRPTIDIHTVSTGEYWLGTQAIHLNLIDNINTSDDYLLTQSKTAQIYAVTFHTKKSFAEKIGILAEHTLQTMKNTFINSKLN